METILKLKQTQVFLMDEKGLEAMTELMENVKSEWQVIQVFFLNGNGLVK